MPTTREGHMEKLEVTEETGEEYVGQHRAPLTQDEFYADEEIWDTEFDDPNA
jgi:hypothetical protein